ncbi:MAG: [NiFe]-hydrogenase assembly chaperone HybE [Curvibacter sp.]|nr:[NiFe]-hydrogenase assembly chaperone HybE [Curvibacter sp.]
MSIPMAPLMPPLPDPALARRCADLSAVFDEVARTRMLGVPVVNPALTVQALGFEPLPREAAPEDGAPPPGPGLGVLITPWFMNLVCLPLQRQLPSRPVGQTRPRRLGPEGLSFDFMEAWHDRLGAYEVCSLFSPMFEFADQAAACATAHEVLKVLRPAPPTPKPQALRPEAPARRAFLFGRGT